MNDDIRVLIRNFSAYFALLGIVRWVHEIAATQSDIAAELNDPTANIGAYRKDGTRHTIPVAPIISTARTPEFNLFYMRMSIVTAVIQITDSIVRAGLMRTTPELQFLRHLRNACAHGNRFHLVAGEPRYPASFKELRILPEHDGAGPVLFDFVMPGDVLDLFEYLEATV